MYTYAVHLIIYVHMYMYMITAGWFQEALKSLNTTIEKLVAVLPRRSLVAVVFGGRRVEQQVHNALCLLKITT